MTMVEELQRRFPNEPLNEEIVEGLVQIGKATNLHPGLVMSVLIEAQKVGWEYVG